MNAPRLFADTALASGARVDLDDDAARHASRVLRMRVGQTLTLFNGDGSEYAAVIRHIDKRRVGVDIEHRITRDRESPLSIHLGLGISRGDRMDQAIRRATELGVAAVSPLQTERSATVAHDDQLAKKQRHWQRVAIGACEQCGRNRLPAVSARVSLEQWLAAIDCERQLVLDPTAASALDPGAGVPGSVALLVGPEGGLTDTEIAIAAAAGFERVRLGPRVLRTETAPLATIAVCQYLWGDLGT